MTEHTCETCAHLNDSGPEYCGACDSLTDNWTEASWYVEERLHNKTRLLYKIKEAAYKACCTGDQQAELKCISLCNEFDKLYGDNSKKETT
jgi:hypothetical protein